MKKIFLIAMACAGLFSCSKGIGGIIEELEDPSLPSNKVSLREVNRYINRTHPSTKNASNVVFSIEPYIKDEDTLMYIVNYGHGGGWEILSTDTRTPAIIAHADSGSFILEQDNIGLCLWLEGVAEDMRLIRKSSDNQLMFSKEEISRHKNIWADAPRGMIIPGTGEEGDDEGGHWYAWGRSVEEDYDEITHMTPRWDQWAPYNRYCPEKTSGSGRMPAGCVAVAGAGVLYYLNSVFGVPLAMYASCSEPVGNSYPIFSDLSTDVWSSMISNYDPTSNRPCYESVMIAYIGKLVNMQYGNSSSSADDSDLVIDVFNYLGISCSRSTYNENSVKASLLSGLPVIVGAYSNFWGTRGHCFVIDGYKRTRTKTITHYEWIPDNPIGDTGLEHRNYSTVEYSSPHISYIQINWGWYTQWTSGLNDGWYALTGSWYVHHQDGSSENYDYYRKMIYGFSVIE